LNDVTASILRCRPPSTVERPNSERHDFVGDQLHLEVKTTRKTRPEHEISPLNQLSVPGGRRLLFVSVQAEQSIGGIHTVATQIDAAVQVLRAYPATLDDFMAKVASVGWSEEMRHSGELLRFDLGDDTHVYEADADFPGLPDDFRLPSDILAVKYTLDLANVPLWA
jgi:hypothetical protein